MSEFNNIKPNNNKTNNSSMYLGNGKLIKKNNTSTIDYNKEKNDDKSKQTKKHSPAAISKLLTLFVAAVAGTAICITGIDSFLSTKINAKLECISILDTSVYYFLELDEFDEHKDTITVLLTNDFTKREQEVEFHSYEGYFENLKPNVKYKLQVLKDGVVIAEKSFKTLTEEEYLNKYEYYENQNYNAEQNDNTQNEKYPKKEEPTTSDEPTTDPNTSDPSTTDPITSDPGTTDPITSDLESSDPITTGD